jgi:hypothetical protein
MARRRTHTEKWWEAAPPHILRCAGHNKVNGERCKSEAAPGTTVCDRHGALIPVVQAAAAQRIQMSVDEAAKHLVDWMGDTSVDMRERVKIAHDLLDRGGLAATQKHLVGIGTTGDAVETLFMDLLSTPGMLDDPAPVQALPAGESADDDIVDAEVVEEPTPAKPKPAPAKPKRDSVRPPKHIRDDLERLGLL